MILALISSGFLSPSITANTSTKVVSGAVIEFTDYGQKIDFTDLATCSFTKFNGWDEMVLGASNITVTTNDNFTLKLKCEFRERLN
jgi:menaquinone-dependent protoporphyrinogen IX oxidase